MATRRIKEYLDGNEARYVILHHSPAYTASEVAAAVHVPGRVFAKVLVVRLDDKLALAVVQATRDLDFALLRDAAGARTARLADEAEFAGRFEGCQRGTVPPFGHLFGMETYVERSMGHEPEVAFNAGTHTDVMVMDFDEYCRLAHPRLETIDAPPVDLKFYAAQL
jgi:Ala-tRNA(Pro) deacylase